ncbi:acyl-coenzyme A thioesterase 6 isoform X4 [Dasypus novemcinctus]|uniref:acyl-coenzyme A thioesterase 6 isoform X4 n=1 Tax=Dasypus novemcinctus TaxID=9361 RepID=UPI00265D8400|nr:acyl-coenzyme A thioesterase 6 isoform X4 [Dasypus novemcinctus]
MATSVTLEPAGRSRWDESVRITVRGLAPGQPVTLRASLRDEKGELFRAHARYLADGSGELDLTRAPALGGSFSGLEPMGLFWALEPEKPFLQLMKRDVQTPFAVELEVLDGHDPEPQRLLCRTVHERDFLPPGVRREPVRRRRVRATLFLPRGRGPFPGIIDVSGSGGGLCEYRASLLAGHGFAMLALAYFRFEDLPEYLKDIHLEYFEEAVDFMLQHPKAKATTIKEALARWEEKTGQKPSEAKEIKLYAQIPPIEKMDASLSMLGNCEKLSLSTNCIEKIANLNGLKNLRILSLGRNNIKNLNGLEVVGDTLEELWISYNFIEKLKGIHVMKKLKILYMSNNLVKDWAEFVKLAELPCLEDLVFVGNPLEEKYSSEGSWIEEASKRVPKLKKLDGNGDGSSDQRSQVQFPEPSKETRRMNRHSKCKQQGGGVK